jgi:uncharacterized protein (UPF0147 family)
LSEKTKELKEMQNVIRTNLKHPEGLPEQIIWMIKGIINNGILPSGVRKITKQLQCDKCKHGHIPCNKCKTALRYLSKILRDHGLEKAKSSLPHSIVAEL